MIRELLRKCLEMNKSSFFVFCWAFCIMDNQLRLRISPMNKKDRNNLIRGMPVYLLCVVLLAGMVILYRQNLSKHGNEPLPKLITKNLQSAGRPSQSVDDVINSRKTWEPILPQWQGKQLPNLTFTLPNGQTKQLSDYAGRQIILILGAVWYPPFKMQLLELEEMTAKDEMIPAVIALTADSADAIKTFLQNNPTPIEMATVDFLPEPFSLPDGFPCIFFIDPQRRLKLAATGLIPISHIQAITQLTLP